MRSMAGIWIFRREYPTPCRGDRPRPGREQAYREHSAPMGVRGGGWSGRIRQTRIVFKVHMRKVPLEGDVVSFLIARGTPGFSGADLANLVNEAALFAARGNKRVVSMQEFELAKDKIMMGAERKSMVMSEDQKESTAYHEAGHAIIGRLVPDHDPVYKVSIIPRGRALGVTMYLPEKDRVSHSREFLESMLSSLYGGRLAEELIYGADKVSTGASNDIERATDIARKMVTQWGFSDKMGPVLYAEDEGEVFLGRSVTQTKHMSDDTARAIDTEVRALIDRNYERAREILTQNMDIMHAMKDALMKYETIDAGQIDDLMERKSEIRAPKGWGDTDDVMKSSESAPESKAEAKVETEEKPVATDSEELKPKTEQAPKEDDKPQA
jgi:cell division protease FtsH